MKGEGFRGIDRSKNALQVKTLDPYIKFFVKIFGHPVSRVLCRRPACPGRDVGEIALDKVPLPCPRDELGKERDVQVGQT